MSGSVWVIFGVLGACVLLAIALAALERGEDEQEPHREEGDEP